MTGDIGYIVFDFVVNIIELLVSLILTPINLIVQPFIPDTTIVNNAINSFFTFIQDIILFVLGWLNLPDICYEFILLYISFLIAYLPVKLGFRIVIKLYHTWKK